jgi:hypothetical protein
LSKSIFYLTWTLQSYEIYKYKNLFVTYKGGNNHRDVRFYADRKVTKPAVHHAPAPAPHHAKAPVKVDKRHGISNHTLASNTPRHGHSNAGHFGRR